MQNPVKDNLEKMIKVVVEVLGYSQPITEVGIGNIN